MTVTGVSVGTAVVELYYVKSDGAEITAQVTINVHNGAFAAEWAQVVAAEGALTYEEADGIGGRDGVMHFNVNGSNNVWSNYLVLSETRHTGAGGTMSTTEAMNNMYSKNYNYIAFDFYLTAGTTLRLTGPDGIKFANIIFTPGSAATYSAGTVYDDGTTQYSKIPATIYNQYGIALSEDAVIAAETWYTVVFQYNRAANSGQWACVQLIRTAGSDVYLDNTRYGYDAACLTPEVSTELVAEIPASVSGTWNGTAVIPVAAYVAGETVTATVSYSVSDETAATCTDGVVTFLKNEPVTVTVTVSYNGQQVQQTVTATPATVMSQSASAAWELAGATHSFTVDDQSEYGTYTLAGAGGALWADYLYLTMCGDVGTHDAEAVANMRENNYNVIVFKVKVTSGTARIYSPVTGGQQNYAEIGTTFSFGPVRDNNGVTVETAEGYIEVYDADGNALENGDATSYGTEYTVVIHYNHATGGWTEVCIKGQACVVEVGGVSFYSA